jgi:hypothetical protein
LHFRSGFRVELLDVPFGAVAVTVQAAHGSPETVAEPVNDGERTVRLFGPDTPLKPIESVTG